VERKPEVGKPVVWHESDGTACDALVTTVWGPTMVNLVIVSVDENKQDGYGRQIERRTSCQHGSINQVHGFYWRFPDEDPNPYIPPISR